MKRGIRSQTQEINGKIVEDFYEGPLSISALMKKYGRSESSVNKLLAADRLAWKADHDTPRVRSGKPADPRLMEDKKSLTFRHMVIGLAISRYVNENQLTPTSFGMLIGVCGQSRVIVGNMMIGSHDLTLCEVDKLSIVLGIPFMDLMEQKKEVKLVAA